MNKSAGLAFATVASLAALRLSSGGGAVALAPVAESRTTPAPVPLPKPPLPKNPGYVGGCTAYSPEPEGASAAYPKQHDYGAALSKLTKFFSDSSPNAAAAQTAGEIHYVVALAPDPRHTNLSVMFDREMVAIQQAAQDEGYVFNSSWLPWSTDSQTFPLLGDQQLHDDLAGDAQNCPGLLLFRRSTQNGDEKAGSTASSPSAAAYSNALVVLIVGEQPTAGINRNQWANALNWLRAQPSKTPLPLHVLGPTFSGSLVSLDRGLRSLAAFSAPATKQPAFGPVQILSGSVSSCSSVQWFLDQNKAIGSTNPVSFGTFQENDELQIYRLLRYLKAHGTASKDVAVLSEDETGYGILSTSSKNCSFNIPGTAAADSPLELGYPRDLSALRAEYQKESVFASVSPGGKTQVHSVLQEGAEPEGGSEVSDTIHGYSGQVTPLAEEAVLYSLVSELRSHNANYVLLRCTNPLDYLFLTRFLHRTYPEARVVIVGQDLLFRREVDTTEFRGVMSLSNYPLLPRDEHWSLLSSPESLQYPHTHRVYESQIAEGEYLAARYSIRNGLTQPATATPPDPFSTLAFPRKARLQGYTDPFWIIKPNPCLSDLADHPPTWLTVVGRDGFWPVAVLNDATTPTTKPATGQKSCPTPAEQHPASTMVRLLPQAGMRPAESNLQELPLAWKLAAACALFLLLYQAYGIFYLREQRSSGPFSIFRQTSTPSQTVLITVACFITLIMIVEVASISLPLPRLEILDNKLRDSIVFMECCTFIAAILLAVFLYLRKKWACVFFSVLALGLAIAWLSLKHRIDYNCAARVSLFYRMGHLTSGVSPLIPVLFLTAGFYLWVWQAMAGNLLLSSGRPLLPQLGTHRPPSQAGRLNRLLSRIDDLRSRFFELTREGKDMDGPELPTNQYRISRNMDKQITRIASPLSTPFGVVGPALIAALAMWLLFGKDFTLHSFEGTSFTSPFNRGLHIAFLLTIAEAGRLFWTWIELRRLLAALNRLRLRRTFSCLHAIPPTSLWGVSGNVQRVQYSFFAQQLDAATRLCNNVDTCGKDLEDAATYGHLFASQNAERLNAAPAWDTPVGSEPNGCGIFIREIYARAVAEVLKDILMPRWHLEDTSLALQDGTKQPAEDATVQAAEEFVCFHYIAFIQNILARMRTMVLSMVSIFVAVCLAISFYPFVPRTQISVWMILNLAMIAAAVIYVYIGMERDETLSYIANTTPGKLGSEFWLKTAAFLAGPVLGLLTTQFPTISDSVLGWLQPGLDAFKP